MMPIGPFIRWSERRLFPKSQVAGGRRSMLTMATTFAERLRDGVFINFSSCFPSINVQNQHPLEMSVGFGVVLFGCANEPFARG
jgi:hypothetical protein